MKTADEIADEVTRLTDKGIEAGAYFLLQRTKEKLSVPAPYRIAYATQRSKLRPPGTPYRVATEPATPGAPPRLLNGLLRASGHVRDGTAAGSKEVVFATPYAAWLEFTANHMYASVTLAENREALAKVIGGPFTGEVSSTGSREAFDSGDEF